MAAEALGALLALIPGRPWLEATIEAAPGGITAERARAWAAAGINRVSLGVQSFVEQEIRRTGRKHTAATVADELALLRAAGIANCNIDLIAGLSGQTEASWRESLDWIARLAPEHVSVYMLEVDEDSRLGARNAARRRALRRRRDALRRPGRRFLRNGRRAPGRHGHPALRDLQFRAARLRIAPQSEILAARTLRRLRRRRALLRRARAPRRTPKPSRSISPARRPAPADACLDEERFFVGLRLAAGIRPEPDEWRRFERPIRRFLDAGLLETERRRAAPHQPRRAAFQRSLPGVSR